MELSTELEAAEKRLRELHSELTALQEQVALHEERLTLLRRLQELDGEPNVQPDERRRRYVLQKRSHGSSMRLEDAVVSILEKHDEPVHIGEIREKLREIGVKIPGKGTDSNIIARIIKEPRIERQRGRRGYYRLAQ